MLLQDVITPPFERIGSLSIDAFMAPPDRRELAAALNTLLASPSFASWREGESLDVQVSAREAEGRFANQ